MASRFIFHDQLTEKTYIIPLPNHIQDDDADEDIIDTLLERQDELELETKFGVHDVGYGGTDFLGFTTYEIESEEKFLELMNIWKGILEEEGFETGELIIETS